MAAADARQTDESGAAAGVTSGRVSVLLPLPLSGAYDYRTDPAQALTRGDFVVVPLGNRDLTGVVWGEALGDVAESKLKDVAGRIEALPLPPVVCDFVDWVAN